MLLFLMSADLNRRGVLPHQIYCFVLTGRVWLMFCDDLKIHCCCLFTLVITANKATGSVRRDCLLLSQLLLLLKLTAITLFACFYVATVQTCLYCSCLCVQDLCSLLRFGRYILLKSVSKKRKKDLVPLSDFPQ